MSMAIPEDSFLIPFLRDSTQRLRQCGITEPCPLEAIRAELLQVQAECLEVAVARNNSNASTKRRQCNESSNSVETLLTVEQAQRILRSLCTDGCASAQVRLAVREMNGAARHAFCRLALYSECLLEVANSSSNCRSCPRHDARHCSSSDDADRGRPAPLRRVGRMERENLLEFIGLCEVAVRLDEVQRYLGAGNSSGSNGRLFSDVPLPEATPLANSILPQDRLEFVQRLLLRAIGYDPSHGHGEIRRIFFEDTHRSNEFSSDAELMDRFAKMSASMDAALTQATLRATLDAFGASSDVTFVSSGSTKMSGEDDRREVLSKEVAIDQRSSRNTALVSPPHDKHVPPLELSQLHQEILGELLTMDEEERTAQLEEARKAEQGRLSRVPRALKEDEDRGSNLAAPMTDFDEHDKTHRLLLTGRVWSTMLQQNGGQPPKFQ
jgi:hypothetical protein